MNVHVLPAGPIQTNAYLLTAPARGEAVLIDAPEGVWSRVEPLLQEEGCRLAGLWLTHGHWDHTQGAAEVVRQSGARVVRPRRRPAAYRDARGDAAAPHARECVVEPVKVDRWLQDGEAIEALGQKVRVSHVPGHCPGSLMFHFPAERRGVRRATPSSGAASGATDLPGGDFGQLEHSIRSRIYMLPADTAVYPGHGGPTTVGEEREHNPYVRA